jgi:hypothetical protein
MEPAPRRSRRWLRAARSSVNLCLRFPARSAITARQPLSEAVARLHPIPDTDRLELLFYWSNDKRWTTVGNLARMKLTRESAQEIVENDPRFRVPRSQCPPFEEWPKTS